MSSKQTITWEHYILGLLEKGYVSRAAIYGIKDGRRWAGSPFFEIEADMLEDITVGFQDSSKLRNTGLCLGSSHFTLTRSNDTVMVGRESASGAGFVIYRCATCFVIAVYNDGGSAGACYSLVNKMGDFLRYGGY